MTTPPSASPLPTGYNRGEGGAVPGASRPPILRALILIAVLLAGCAAPPGATPAPTPSPFPTFDLNELPPPPGGVPSPEVSAYLAGVANYTTPSIIAVAPQFTPERLDEIVATLEAITPPPEMQPAHETLLKGYHSIADGRHLQVENISDNQLQAEARSLTDFGQVLLQEHVQIVDAYLVGLRATPVP